MRFGTRFIVSHKIVKDNYIDIKITITKIQAIIKINNPSLYFLKNETSLQTIYGTVFTKSFRKIVLYCKAIFTFHLFSFWTI